jgi:DNA invertase Pin-like site-specific DNA recombinase
MLPTRVYYIRISDDRQDTLRQVNGLKEMALKNGDAVPESLWQTVLNKQPLPITSPVLWDYGSRDMVEKRPNFMALTQRVEKQDRRDPTRLQELCIYELDRFGVEGPDHWFHNRYIFDKAGCRIMSAQKGDLTAKEDLKTIIETLFDAIHSRAEQKKIAGRVADQMAQLAKDGKLLGGVPRYGYDLGCFDGEKLIWRLHYRDISDRLQIVATDDNLQALLTGTAQTVHYTGKDNYPKKAKKQEYKLIPSIDTKRVEGIQFLFKTYRDQGRAMSGCELARQMSLMGYASYQSRSFDPENLFMMLEDDTYVGVRPHGKRSVARHKRYNKNVTDQDGRNLEDVSEDAKGQTVWREKADWIVPPSRTHEPLVDAETFQAVQNILAGRPKRGKKPYGPRGEDGWLKPVTYCAGCGRQMIITRSRGQLAYHCVTYNYKYQRPNDPRYQCEAGFNSIRHATLAQAVEQYLDGLERELMAGVETDAIKRLEAEVAQYEALAAQHATSGYKTHLSGVRDALELDERPGELADLIRRLLAATDADEQLDGLAQVEQVLPSHVRHALDQAKEELRRYTKAIGRAEASSRQVSIWQDECRLLEQRMDKLEGLLVPYRQQSELVQKRYQEKLDQLTSARRALASAGNRAKGAALARLYFRILVHPKSRPSPRALILPFWDDPVGGQYSTPKEAKDELIGFASSPVSPLDLTTGTDSRFITPKEAVERLAAPGDDDNQRSDGSRNRCPSPLSFSDHGSPRMW